MTLKSLEISLGQVKYDFHHSRAIDLGDGFLNQVMHNHMHALMGKMHSTLI